MSGTLVVCAHPDDEVLGCGGTIAKWGDCSVVALTEGVTSRGTVAHDERLAAFNEACGILGAKRWKCVGLRDQRLDAMDLLDVVRGVERLILEYAPERVLTHHLGDLNKDHRIVAEAVLVATRPPARYEVYSFEVPSSTEWAFGMEPVFRPNVFVSLTPELFERKMSALCCYESELRPYPHPRSESAIEARSLYWGQVSGCFAAESFMLLRGYR